MHYTVEDLERLPLYRLREIGREIGVRAPTSCNKKQLIYFILDIQYGYTKPCVVKRSRPIIKLDKQSNENSYIELEKLNKIETLIKECKKQIYEILSTN